MIRVDDATWDAAKQAAEDRNENLSDQIRRFLIRYARARRRTTTTEESQP